MSDERGKEILAGIIEANAAALAERARGYMNAVASNGADLNRTLSVSAYFAAVMFAEGFLWAKNNGPPGRDLNPETFTQTWLLQFLDYVERISAATAAGPPKFN